MSLRRSALSALLAAVVIVPASLHAQSKSTFSVQASGMYFYDGSSEQWNPAAEGQVRLSFGRFSIGLGYMQVFFPELAGTGLSASYRDIFLEPRFVVAGGESAGWYLAGRVGRASTEAVLTLPGFGSSKFSSDDLTYGGGTGVLIRLTDNLALDVGAQAYKLNVDGSNWNYQARVGLSIGIGN